jgi:hypothetical protein
MFKLLILNFFIGVFFDSLVLCGESHPGEILQLLVANIVVML